MGDEGKPWMENRTNWGSRRTKELVDSKEVCNVRIKGIQPPQSLVDAMTVKVHKTGVSRARAKDGKQLELGAGCKP